MTEESHTDAHDERATLGALLSANAELVVGVLRPAEGAQQVPVLAALTATRNLGNLVDDILHTLARQAREEGHTWAELGDLLGTSRQAAFQRFSGPMPPTGPFPPPPHFPPGPHRHPNQPRPPAPPDRPPHHLPAPPGPPVFPGPGDRSGPPPPVPPGAGAPQHSAPPHPQPPAPPGGGTPEHPAPPHPQPPSGGTSDHSVAPRFPKPPSPPR
ncbi:hypothetical protein [Nocardia sp. NPDC005366]|uniref:hypothetical protein n=1 Tax=Nocardia sp. NPDC005366 TaxID=3156878 RepID=UPI0033BA9378